MRNAASLNSSSFVISRRGLQLNRYPKSRMSLSRLPRMIGVVLFSLAGLLMTTVPALVQTPISVSVSKLSKSEVESMGLNPFYSKIARVHGFPIVGSDKVSDEALMEAGWILSKMLEPRLDLLSTMASKKVKLTVMAWTEFTTDIPEHAHLKPRVYWDRRARGLGATPHVPTVSCAEENLLDFPGDPYSTENILIHEFAHAVHETGMNVVDPSFDRRLADRFHSATNRGLWRGTYAASNRQEYWAEGVQSWFDNNRENDALHNHVNTRAELKAYDSGLAALCAEVLGEGAWRYQKPQHRDSRERAHLARLDLAKAPRFKWRAEPVTDKPRVSMQTELGVIELELDRTRAPITVTNFLRYVEAGFYNGGQWFRTVRSDNQPNDAVKIAVIQASANADKAAEFFPPIPIERTRDSGLRHLDGTISMARTGPDTAQHDIFICIGDQPELDFGGRRNPDGQGFAAFGRVVKGMEMIRAIHERPAEGQRLTTPLKIQRVTRLE